MPADRRQSSLVTATRSRAVASPSSFLRKNSFRDNPSAPASASMRATASSLSPLMRTFDTSTTSSTMISRYHRSVEVSMLLRPGFVEWRDHDQAWCTRSPEAGLLKGPEPKLLVEVTLAGAPLAASIAVPTPVP